MVAPRSVLYPHGGHTLIKTQRIDCLYFETFFKLEKTKKKYDLLHHWEDICLVGESPALPSHRTIKRKGRTPETDERTN